MEGLAKISEQAEALYGSDANGYMNAMTGVIMGIDTDNTSVMEEQFREMANLKRSGQVGFDAGVDLLPYKEGSAATTSQIGDWNPKYFDGSANQAYHFWAYVSEGYYHGSVIANLGNDFHDPLPNSWTDAPWNPGSRSQGRSVEDHNLAAMGVRLGSAYYASTHCSMRSCGPTLKPSLFIRTELINYPYSRN